MAPRASARQYGANRPENAGTAVRAAAGRVLGDQPGVDRVAENAGEQLDHRGHGGGGVAGGVQLAFPGVHVGSGDRGELPLAPVRQDMVAELPQVVLLGPL